MSVCLANYYWTLVQSIFCYLAPSVSKFTSHRAIKQPLLFSISIDLQIEGKASRHFTSSAQSLLTATFSTGLIICGKKAHLQRRQAPSGEWRKDKVPVLWCVTVICTQWTRASCPMCEVKVGKIDDSREVQWHLYWLPSLLLLPICFINHFQIYLMKSQEKSRVKTAKMHFIN